MRKTVVKNHLAFGNHPLKICVSGSRKLFLVCVSVSLSCMLGCLSVSALLAPTWELWGASSDLKTIHPAMSLGIRLLCTKAPEMSLGVVALGISLPWLCYRWRGAVVQVGKGGADEGWHFKQTLMMGLRAGGESATWSVPPMRRQLRVDLGRRG